MCATPPPAPSRVGSGRGWCRVEGRPGAACARRGAGGRALPTLSCLQAAAASGLLCSVQLLLPLLSPPHPHPSPPPCCSRGLRAGHPRAAALPQGRVPVQEELAGAAHRHQNRAADCDPHGLRRAAAPQVAGRHCEARWAPGAACIAWALDQQAAHFCCLRCPPHPLLHAPPPRGPTAPPAAAAAVPPAFPLPQACRTRTRR